MLVIPAIDLKDGRCVRLLQGREDREIVFSHQPSKVARTWEQAGAELIHVVDLDGAFKGKPINRDVIKEIVDAVKVPIQLGGGLRSLMVIEEYIALGVNRVVLGTVAIQDPGLVEKACKKFPGRILVTIDAKDGMVVVKGWVEESTVTASELAKRLEAVGVAAVVFTDIKRDGMMVGPNIQAAKELAQSVSIPVIISGGISSLNDIREIIPLKAAGIIGMIIGRAIYDGSVDLRAAINLVKGSRVQGFKGSS
jgi:phosphoribosylformimino-5-aminoimidazole carboxamide ribotide isomerase